MRAEAYITRQSGIAQRPNERKRVETHEIVEELLKTDDWHPKTAKTLIHRLVKKGALTFEEHGRTS